MKWLRSTYGTALLGIPLLVAAGPATSAFALTGWTIQASANLNVTNNALADVAALSPTDVWAVGYAFNGTYQPLIEHSTDGTSWSTVPAAAPPLRNNRLSGMTAVSASDIWAVGSSPVDKLHNSPLAEQYDGSRWSLVTPVPVGARSGLGAVSATGPNDVWAVGSSNTNGPLVEHWTGSSTGWTVASTPVMAGSTLTGVAALPNGEVWAVGVTASSGFALHLTSGTWTPVQVPPPSVAHSNWALYDLTATSASDLWAVGSLTAPDGLSSQPVVSHFNGSVWETTVAPSLGTNTINGFAAVRAAASDDVWAVGNSGPGNQTFVTLTERFNGTRWSVVPSQNRAGQNNGLSGVASAGNGDWWAVGSSYPPTTGVQQTLVEHFPTP